MSDLQISISSVETINLGDHGERQTYVHEYKPGETVEELVRRIFGTYGSVGGLKWRRPPGTDKIVLKVVVDEDRQATGP